MANPLFDERKRLMVGSVRNELMIFSTKFILANNSEASSPGPGNCGVKLMNFKTFQNMAANIDLSIAFLRNVGIIPGSLECEACCLQMAQHKRADISDQKIYTNRYLVGANDKELLLKSPIRP
ncbi:hypothetical protein RF11_09462 [Thelohanellus kitauei]|uniref:Uncharacterized protein n=1 Tax=Thelohanellus kitauei TaxID=669202 RepID=A0A0C2MFU7_THEKT|nr:hypothetical protein RF11_09462 [Thelohanellus kitauei]